jgi:branched-chain amino acid transport system permease protein
MKTDKFIHSRRSRILAGIAFATFAAVASPFLLGGNQYARDVVQVALVFALFATAWDFLCGLTGEVSFGHSLFVGMAAYATALAQARLDLPPALAVLVGTAVGTLGGLLVGLLTLQQTGAVFAMVTMAVQLTFHRTLFIWSRFFGGEEGISVSKALVHDATAQYWLTVVIAIGGLTLAMVLRGTRFGRQLQASGGDTRVGLVCGVPVPWVRVAGATVSGFLASVGGSLLVMQNMSANQEMAGDALAGLIFLLAVIGGTGTLIGPWLAGMVYVCVLRQALVWLGRAEPVAMFGILLLLTWLLPDGIANALSRWRSARPAARSGEPS